MKMMHGLDKNNVIIFSGNSSLCDYWEQVDSSTCSQKESNNCVYVLRKNSKFTVSERFDRYNKIGNIITMCKDIPKLTIIICENNTDGHHLEGVLINQYCNDDNNLQAKYYRNPDHLEIDVFVTSIIRSLYSKDIANDLCGEFINLYNKVYEVI